MKCKAFIQNRRFDELLLFLDKINKKKEVIPYIVVAEMLYDIKDRDRAIGYLKKMHDVDKLIEWLKFLKEYREAVKIMI
jgi:hypothetical protein